MSVARDDRYHHPDWPVLGRVAGPDVLGNWRAGRNPEQLAAPDLAPACTIAGLSRVHFHDLRHTRNDLTAAAGANLRELMERIGHSSTRAALIYLHASTERQRTLADTVSDRARAELRPAGRKRGRADASGHR